MYPYFYKFFLCQKSPLKNHNVFNILIFLFFFVIGLILAINVKIMAMS